MRPRGGRFFGNEKMQMIFLGEGETKAGEKRRGGGGVIAATPDQGEKSSRCHSQKVRVDWNLSEKKQREKRGTLLAPRECIAKLGGRFPGQEGTQ